MREVVTAIRYQRNELAAALDRVLDALDEWETELQRDPNGGYNQSNEDLARRITSIAARVLPDHKPTDPA